METKIERALHVCLDMEWSFAFFCTLGRDNVSDTFSEMDNESEKSPVAIVFLTTSEILETIITETKQKN